MLDRRQMLATTAALWAGGAFTPTKAFTQDKDGRIFAGWVPPVGQPRPKRTRIRAIRGAGQNTVRLLWKELEELSGRPFEPHHQNIGDCFAADTVVSGPSHKMIQDIRVGDSVLNGRGQLTRVINTRKLPCRKQMVEVKPNGLPVIRCTEDHRFLVYSIPRVSRRRVSARRYERVIAGHRNDRRQDVIDSFEGRKPKWVEAKDLKDTDYVLCPADLGAHEVPGEFEEIIKIPHVAFMLGYFLGDGHCSENGGSIEITVATDHYEVMKCIMNAIFDIGFTPYLAKYKGRNAYRIRFNSREYVKLFRDAFYDGKQKTAPLWLLSISEGLNGLVTADGCQYNSRHSSLYSTSPYIAYASYLASIGLGYVPIISCKDRKNHACYANAKPIYTLEVRDEPQRQFSWRDDDFVARPVEQVTPVDSVDFVYDIEVESEDHSFIANGVVVHNCTSQAATLGRKTLDAQHGIWTGDLCTETTYSGSRVQIGKGALGFDYNDRRGGGGSTGIWTAQWLKQFGVVPRGSYPEGDLSRYRSDLALRWGQPRAGCPQGLVAKCVRPIERFAIADNWLDACDLVASGIPVMICSPVGFGNGTLPVTPDYEGFLTPGVQWMHAMLLWGIDTKSMRHGGCIANSWGRNWINPRPHKLGTPAGCFWAEARVIDRMLKGFRDRGGFVSDSYAYFLGDTMPVDPVEPEEEQDPEWYFGLNNETSPILDANGQSYRAAA